VLYEFRDGRRVALGVTVHGALIREAMKPAPTGPAGDKDTVAGTLARVAFTEREIVVVTPGARGADSETTFAVPEGTAITRDQKPVKLDDLKEGEKVAVRGAMKDGKRVAQSIEVGAVARNAPAGRDARIERLRQLLHQIDDLLRMAEEQSRRKP
jgi:hypothetical protein